MFSGYIDDPTADAYGINGDTLTPRSQIVASSWWIIAVVRLCPPGYVPTNGLTLCWRGLTCLPTSTAATSSFPPVDGQ